MARVLFIQPPLLPDELFARGSKQSASIIPPLGLAYMAAYLQQHGHHCRIYDGIAEPQPFSSITTMASDYDVVGITVVSAYAKRAIELLHALRESNVETPLVVGGPHVTAMPGDLLGEGADYAVIGEGEQTMLELVEALSAGGKSIGEIPGLMCRYGERTIRSEPRQRIAPLDVIPLPARDLLPMHLYRSSIARASQQPSHSLLTSRGCPGICSFCSKLTFGTATRYFSAERIVEEFFLLRDKYGARDVAVWDDNFVSDLSLVMSVCEELRRKQFNRTWSVEARIDGVDEPTLKALKSAGCSYIAYGIESGSQRVLDYIHKRITLKQIRETVALTKKLGIKIRGYFMMGFPGESIQEMEQTALFARELDVDIASFTLFVPLPGTQEYRRAQQTGIFDPLYYRKKIVPEFNFPSDPIYVPAGMTAGELLSLHQSAYNRYYFRPYRIAREFSGIRSWGEVRTFLQGGMTLLKNWMGKHDA